MDKDKRIKKKDKIIMGNNLDNNTIGHNTNIEDDGTEVPFVSGVRTKILINKQDVIQKVSNSTMCHAFASAEYLVLRICDQNQTVNNVWKEYQNMFGNYPSFKLYSPIFDQYDAFDGGKNKPIKDLICQLIFQTENFKDDYYSYMQKNKGKYNFPSNLSSEQILRILLLWRNELKNIEQVKGKLSEYGCSKYIENLFNVISCKPTVDYSMDIYKFEAKNPNRGKLNPEGLLKGNMLASHHLENEDLKNPTDKDVPLFGKNKLFNSYDSQND